VSLEHLPECEPGVWNRRCERCTRAEEAFIAWADRLDEAYSLPDEPEQRRNGHLVFAGVVIGLMIGSVAFAIYVIWRWAS
jgi:hypothetical protein